MSESVEETGFMDTINSFFGRAKQDRTSIFTHGHETKIDPIFILLMEALAHLVMMNPTAFEFKSSYLAWIASEMHTNRFWEFVQSNKQDQNQVELPCIFSPEFRQTHKSKIYDPQVGESL